MALSLVRTPENYGYYMDCWLCALATLLGVTYYEAYVLMFGGPPPAVPEWGGTSVSNLQLNMKKFERRVKKLGIVPAAAKDYRKKKTPRFLIGCYRTRQGFYGSLHCVVWDPETKSHLDSADYDSFTERNAIIVKAYRKKSGVRVVTGVTIPASAANATPEPERDMTNHERRMDWSGILQRDADRREAIQREAARRDAELAA